MKSQLFKLLTAIALLVGFILFVYTNTQKKPAAIIPLTYNTTKSLQDFNFSDIEKYPTSAGTYDLQTMATNITSQMLNIFSNSSEKALPLVGNWNVGIPEDSDGLDPMYMINRLTYGEHVIPAWDLDPYYSNGISLSYYEESIKKAAELNLPLVFICPSFASALTNDSVYFNMNTIVNPNVISTDGTLLPKLSPFGDNDLWNEVGNQWSTTSLMQQIQEWYPNPPLVLFIEKNRAPKLLWSKLSLSKRYNTVYGIDKSDEFKKTLVNAQWLEKYRQLHEGFKEGLTQNSWKNNVRFLTKDQLAINMGTATNWMDFTTTTNQYMNLWPLTADGLNVDINFSSDTSYDTVNNLPPMLGEAKAQNSDFVSQLGLDDINTSEDLERYRGYVQFALWFTRPGLVRHKSNQTKKDDIYILYQQVVDSVDLIYNNEVLSDFWKHGKLLSTGSSNLNLNIPTAYQNIPREFLLKTDSNEIVWSFALEKGEAPNREWLIYMQSPEKNVTNVTVNFTPYGNLTLDASKQGSFYVIKESTKDTTTNTTSSEPILQKDITTNTSSLEPVPEWDVGIERDWTIDQWLASGLLKEDPRVIIDTKDAIDVTKHGMVGDGVTDDSSAFQTILNTYPKIKIPKGKVFLIKNTVKLNSKTTLIYGGGELRFAKQSGSAALTASNVKLSGSLTIDGIIFNQQSGTGNSSLIFQSALDNFNTTVQNCTFKMNPKLTANATGGSCFNDNQRIINARYINNTFINITRYPIEITNRNYDSIKYLDKSVDGVQILYNRFYNNTGIRKMAVSLAADTNGHPNFLGHITNTKFIGNYIENAGLALEVTGHDTTEFSYNTLKNIAGPMGGGAPVSKNITAKHNYIYITQEGGNKWGFGCDNLTMTNNQIKGEIEFGDNLTNAEIADNKFYNIGSAKPIFFKGSQNINFYNNYVEGIDVAGSGLLVFYNCNTDSNISNNRGYTNTSVPLIFSYGDASPTISQGQEVGPTREEPKKL